MPKPIANALGVMGAIAAIANLAWAYPGAAAAPADSNYPQGASTLTSSQEIAGFRDVSPSDPYFLALKNLVEEYGLDNLGFSDRTFRGDLPLKRGDFVMYFDQGLENLRNKVIEESEENSDYLLSQSPQELSKLEEFKARLAAAADALESLEGEIKQKLVLEKVACAAGKNGGCWEKPERAIWQASLVAKIPSVHRVTDVSPSDRYFRALQNFLERYGIDVLLADGTFQGERSLTRGEFAIYFSEWLDCLKDDSVEDNQGRSSELLHVRHYINVNKRLDKINGWERLDAVEEAVQRLANRAEPKIALEKITLEKIGSAPASQSRYSGYRRLVLNNAIAWVTSVNEVNDVSPDDYYFSALKSLIERYLIYSILRSDGTFQGNASLTRGDFVVNLDEYFNNRTLLVRPVITQPPHASEVVGEIERTVEDLETRVAALEAVPREN